MTTSSLIGKFQHLKDQGCPSIEIGSIIAIISDHTAAPVNYHAATAAYMRLGFDKNGRTIEGNIYDLIKQVVDAAMGDAFTREDEVTEKPVVGQSLRDQSPATPDGIFDQPFPGEPGHYHTSDPDLQRGEILDNEDETIDNILSLLDDIFNTPCECGTPDGEARCSFCNKAGELERMIRALKPRLKPMKPVSLKQCAKVLEDSMVLTTIDVAKRVLDAAGVKYVD